MPNGPLEVEPFHTVRVRKELMASLVCAWTTNDGGFRQAIRNAADEQALRNVLRDFGYTHEMNNQEIAAVVDFNRKTLKRAQNPMTPQQVDAELISKDTLGPGATHLRG